ncbi:MAG: hypothetical protein ACRDTP_06660 [Mycobacteriales bacterium]
MARRLGSARRAGIVVAALVAGSGVLAACSSSNATNTSRQSGHVLLVGTFHGHAGGYPTIQAAVNAAHPGDWILVAPGDYHENDDATAAPSSASAGGYGDDSGGGYGEGGYGGVLVTTPNIHIRGMNRASVIVDGTKSGAPACSADPSQQSFGRTGPDGKAVGRNGIVVFQADNVSIDNLTVCNFLAGTGGSGNEIWWNGGSGTAQIGLHGYEGSYLTTTSSYFGTEDTAVQYGIFSSDAAGDGARWDHVYANNFNDSGAYVGACQQVCDVTIDHSQFENNALGYSGTNSGGAVVIENSQFDHNEEGLDTNTEIGGDPPAPQDGACPNGATSPITGTTSCWVFEHNDVHDNNNPNTPRAGSAAAGPTGTGMTISGGRNDTVLDNTFANNGAWGFLFVPYPDSDKPSAGQSCTAKGGVENAAFGCLFPSYNNVLKGNTFVHDGFFGNPSNSDFGNLVLFAGKPRNCFVGNTAPAGSAPADLAQTQPSCDGTPATATDDADLLAQVLCDTGFGSCPAGAKYPKTTGVVMTPVPAGLATMPNPCAGVPSNAWCRSGKPI